MRLLKILIALPFALIAALLLALVIASYTVPGLEIGNIRGLFYLLTGLGAPEVKTQEINQQIKAAAGYKFSVYARDVPNPRMMVFTDKGTLLVSSPLKGTIYRLGDTDNDGQADELTPLLTDLKNPHGLELHNGWLYVAETHQVTRVRFDPETETTQGTPDIIISGLPDDGGHSTRTVRIGPDEKMYLTIGSNCNACVEEDSRRGTMMQFNIDGSGGRIYASGIRNSVDFDWVPSNAKGSGELFATDNGRDMLGNDFPPCELNNIVDGGFYGWPYVNGFGEPDPDHGQKPHPENSISPAFGFKAHNAPIGIRFLRHSAGNNEKEKIAIVALHGSWNRNPPDGYKVVSLHWQTDGNIVEKDFLSGFLKADGSVIGRPAGVVESTDGSIYISDDYIGIIYRVEKR